MLPTLISPEQHRLWHKAPEEIPDPTPFGDRLEFTVGDRRFELHATPSGETLDALIVWLPDERTVFTGNFMGALQGALPNFYTARGDRDRSMVRFLQDIELLIGLSPTLLITGHGEPIHGEEAIRASLTKLRDAVKHIRDETVAGMNAQKSLHRLMREINLPPHLEHLPGRGRVSWYVRAMWEEINGWFRQESTTELYEHPQHEIFADLVELAGADRLAERAQAQLEAGRPVHALHLTDIVKSVDATHRRTREVEIEALQRLTDAGRGELLDEQGWLETELANGKASIGAAGP